VLTVEADVFRLGVRSIHLSFHHHTSHRHSPNYDGGEGSLHLAANSAEIAAQQAGAGG
jgi:hypothetical protein